MLWLALALWSSFGPILAIVMGRRGHSAASWGLGGLFLGPLVVPAAVQAARSRPPLAIDVVIEALPGPGPLAVLAGIDGSEESISALRQAVALLGDRAGKLTMVAVEAMDEVGPHGKEWLRVAAASIPGVSPEEVVTTGEPAAVLARLAVEGHYDLLVVGPTGRGLSPLLFGSVARALSAGAPVPLLLGGRVAAPSAHQVG